MDLLLSSADIGRPLLAPQGVPDDRVAALRLAFDETMRDPAFLADVEKAGLDLNPLSGAKLQNLIAGFSGVSPAILARARELLRPPQSFQERR